MKKCNHTVVTPGGYAWECVQEHKDEKHYMVRVLSASLAS